MPDQALASKARLRTLLIELFSEDELDTLCQDLEGDYETVPGKGKGKEGRAREIVTYFRSSRSADRCRRLVPSAAPESVSRAGWVAQQLVGRNPTTLNCPNGYGRLAARGWSYWRLSRCGREHMEACWRPQRQPQLLVRR